MSISRGGLALAVVLLVVLGAGCGGDDTQTDPAAEVTTPAGEVGSGSSSTSTSPPTSVATTATTTLVDGDDVVAPDGLVPVILTQEDLGADWEHAWRGPTPSMLTTFVQEGQCARPEDGAFPQPLDTEDADFRGGEGWREADQVSSAAGRFAADGADRWFDTALDRVTRCEDPSIVAKEIVPLDLGDEAVLFQIGVDLGPTITTIARFDVAMARVGDVVAVVGTLTASVDALDEVQLLRTMVDRL